MGDVEITAVEPFLVENPWKPWAFVRVETNAGVTGIGEATLPRNARTIEAAIEEERDNYIGESPFDTERLFLEMYRDRGGMLPNIVNMAVISAMDTACWDIKGKLLERPVHDLIGGRVHRSIRAYANGWYGGTGGDPTEFAAAAERVVEDGYDALKFDPFGTAWQRMDRRSRRRSIEAVEAVREAVGPDREVIVEGHYRFTPSAAVEIAKALEPYEPMWFEQPTPGDSLSALRKVVRRSPVPIAVDRSPDLGVDVDLLETGVDVLQPDPLYTGGVTGVTKIAARAEAEYVDVAPHNAQGPISTALCAHLDAATPNFLIQEVFEDYAHPDWADRLVETPIAVEDGRLSVPEGPGLGVELDWSAVRDHEYTGESSDEIMNLFETGWENRGWDEEEDGH